MIVTLAEQAADVMLDALAGLLDAGSLELLSGDGKTLAILKLSDPAAMAAASGELVFNRIIEEDSALARGRAQKARVLGSNGDEIFSCDVTDVNGDGVIKLNTVQIFAGGPVRIRSFTLAMP